MDELGLFDTPIKPPGRRGKSSSCLGAAGKTRSAAPTPVQASVNEEVGDASVPAAGLSPRETVQQHLEQHGIRYVKGETARAALLSGDRLRLFDFVAHGEQVSWLVAACDREPKDGLLADLHEWERILGFGFVAAVASVDEDGTITFHTIEGESVDLV